MQNPPTSYVVPVSLLLCAVACAFTPPAAAAQKDEQKRLGQVLAGLHVVEGNIVSIRHVPEYSDDNGIVSRVDLEVSRVYCGEGVQDNAKFTAMMGQGRPRTGNWELPVLDWRAGTHRIWLIVWNAEQGRYSAEALAESALYDADTERFLTDNAQFLLPFLGNQLADQPASLEAAPKVAAALRSLATAKDDAERIGLLEEQVRSGDPFVAVTDCWLLDKADATANRANIAIELFLDPKVPIVARTSLDWLVRSCAEPSLKRSRERDRAYLEMAAAARTASEFLSIGIAIAKGAGLDLSIAECVEVMRSALRNEHFLSTVDQRTAADFVAFAAEVKTDEDRDRVFALFETLIGPAADGRFEFAAARGIGLAARVRPLSSAQIDRLSALRKASRNRFVVGDLEATISNNGK